MRPKRFIKPASWHPWIPIVGMFLVYLGNGQWNDAKEGTDRYGSKLDAILTAILQAMSVWSIAFYLLIKWTD